MKIYGIQKDEQQPCNIIKTADHIFMFDCPLNWSFFKYSNPLKYNIQLQSDMYLNQTPKLCEARSQHISNISLENLCGFDLKMIDLSLVDALFISNPYFAYALPLLFHFGFRGTIISTIATQSFLLMLLKEFQKFFESSVSVCCKNNSSKIRYAEFLSLLKQLHDMYSHENIQKCFGDAVTLNYNQIHEYVSFNILQ
ncbi:MAG: Integrator complex subunit 9 [Marteilia pararefringens]